MEAMTQHNLVPVTRSLWPSVFGLVHITKMFAQCVNTSFKTYLLPLLPNEMSTLNHEWVTRNQEITFKQT